MSVNKFMFIFSMCGFANPLSFKNVTDVEISMVATFIKEKTMTFLQQMLNDSMVCDVLVDDETLFNHFGELYAHKPELFEFHIGDIILIKELVGHVKRIVDGNGINKGLSFFQNTKRNQKRTAARTARTYKFPKNVKKESTKQPVKPIENDNLKADLVRKVTTLLEPYTTDMCANDATLNLSECVVVSQTEDESKIYGNISCIICKAENRKNQNPKSVYYNKKGKTRGSWVLANMVKHLQSAHTSTIQMDKNIEFDSQHATETQFVVSREEHSIVEPYDNYDLSVIMVDDSELKKNENCDQDTQDELYTQLATQITNMMAASLTHNETQHEMKYVLSKAPLKLTVAEIPGDGSCMFSALAHQLWMYEIKSKQHKHATKQLRAEVVEHILNPANYPLYQHLLRDRVYEIADKSGKNITDMENECKFFVRHILSNSQTWGGSETLLAVSNLHSTNIFVFNENGVCSKTKRSDLNHSRSIAIAFRVGLNEEGEEVFNHYDSVCEINPEDLLLVAGKCSKHKKE